MLNCVYLLSRYLIGINEKCQLDYNSKRVEFGTYLCFGTDLESTHGLYGSTRTKKKEARFRSLKLESTPKWNGSTHIVKSSELILGIKVLSRLD